MNDPGGPQKPQDGKKKTVDPSDGATPEEFPALLPSADDDAWLDAETFDSLVSSVADEIDDDEIDDDEPEGDEPGDGDLGSHDPTVDAETSADPLADAAGHEAPAPDVEISVDPLAGLEFSIDPLADVEGSEEPEAEAEIPVDPLEDAEIPVDPLEDAEIPVDPLEDAELSADPLADAVTLEVPRSQDEPSEDSLSDDVVPLTDEFFVPVAEPFGGGDEAAASAAAAESVEPSFGSMESGERGFDSLTEMSFEVEFDSSESRKALKTDRLVADEDEDSLDLSMQAVLPSVMEQETDIPNDKLLDLLAVVQEFHRAAIRRSEGGDGEKQRFRVGSIESSRRGDVVRTRLDVPPMQVTVELAYGAMAVSTIAMDVEFASVTAPSHQQLPEGTVDYRSLKGDEGHFSQIRFERDRGVADEVFGVLSQDALAEVHRFACDVVALVRTLDT